MMWLGDREGDPPLDGRPPQSIKADGVVHFLIHRISFFFFFFILPEPSTESRI